MNKFLQSICLILFLTATGLAQGDSIAFRMPIIDEYTGITGIEVMNVNGRGNPEVLITQYGGKVGYIFLASNARSYNPLDELNEASNLVVGDFKGDQELDIAYSGDGNIGFTGFDHAGLFPDFQTGVFDDFDVITAVGTGDLHGTGRTDIIFGDAADNKIWGFEAAGNNLFGLYTIDDDVDRPGDIAAHDFNGDGYEDFIYTDFFLDYVAIYVNDGSGRNFDKVIIDGDADNANQLSLADLDNDGDMDIICSLFSAEQIVIYYNNNNLTFTKEILDNNMPSANKVESGDFNQDGLIDIVATEIKNNKAYIYHATPSGYDKILLYDGVITNDIEIGDINSDDYPDILAANTEQLLYFYNVTQFQDEDLDGDGYTILDDCNDFDAEINPGADEIPYNGIDDDCDPDTSDDDVDNDGFLLADDCDDDNALIYPGAQEICDNLDNNCDAIIDEGLNFFAVYEDKDGDGFGVDNTETMDCLLNTGFTLEPGDCDDNNPNINPDADDIPNNGIDEDCDGMDLMSSIHELSNIIINIYPNPVIDVINIDVDGNLDYKVILYDMKGKSLKTSSNIKQLQITGLPIGTYILEIQDLESSQKIVERIVKGR